LYLLISKGICSDFYFVLLQSFPYINTEKLSDVTICRPLSRFMIVHEGYTNKNAVEGLLFK